MSKVKSGKRKSVDQARAALPDKTGQAGLWEEMVRDELDRAESRLTASIKRYEELLQELDVLGNALLDLEEADLEREELAVSREQLRQQIQDVLDASTSLIESLTLDALLHSLGRCQPELAAHPELGEQALDLLELFKIEIEDGVDQRVRAICQELLEHVQTG